MSRPGPVCWYTQRKAFWCDTPPPRCRLTSEIIPALVMDASCVSTILDADTGGDNGRIWLQACVIEGCSDVIYTPNFPFLTRSSQIADYCWCHTCCFSTRPHSNNEGSFTKIWRQSTVLHVSIPEQTCRRNSALVFILTGFPSSTSPPSSSLLCAISVEGQLRSSSDHFHRT